ncbi:MAG: ester cyclase [Flavobacteriales bacterium]|nr:ester cyclase [Flavobacteriales bacterium]
MTTAEVANRWVSLCRENKNVEAIHELYANRVLSAEPDEVPDKQMISKEAIRQREIQFREIVEKFHEIEISDPIVRENHFSCGMTQDVTIEGPGRVKLEQICVYKVENGKIIEEEFFFTPIRIGHE